MTLHYSESKIRVQSLQKLVNLTDILKKKCAEKSSWYSNLREYLQYGIDVEQLAQEIGMSVRSTYDYIHALIAILDVLDVCQDVSNTDLNSHNVTETGEIDEWDPENEDEDYSDFDLRESQSNNLQELSRSVCQDVSNTDLNSHNVTETGEIDEWDPENEDEDYSDFDLRESQSNNLQELSRSVCQDVSNTDLNSQDVTDNQEFSHNMTDVKESDNLQELSRFYRCCQEVINQ